MRQQLYDKITAYIIENQNRFYRLAYSYVKNQEDALDKYEGLKNEDAVKTWFYRILINESIGYLNRKSRKFLQSRRKLWTVHIMRRVTSRSQSCRFRSIFWMRMCRRL